MPEVRDEWIPFYYELAQQSSFVLAAAEEMEEALQTHPLVQKSPLPHPWQQERFWYSVQSLLVAAGMLSKLLFPIKKDSAERGKKLRELLSVPANSPLESRDLRNIFEHIDERLDHLARMPENLMILDGFVDPHKLVDPNQEVVYGRTFHSETWVLSYMEKRYELKPVVKAASDLHEKLKRNHDLWLD